MKNILIIGGDGYIGTRLGKFLSNVTILDITDSGRYQDFDKEYFKNFNVIILLAGQSSVASSNDIESVFENSILNFKNLIMCLNEKQQFIYASSSSIYGKTNGTVTEENNYGYSYNYYDFSKQTIDNLAKLYFENTKHEYYGLRFGTVCGFSENFRNDIMINSMVFNSKKNKKIFISNKSINRPILGLNDLCNAIKTIIENGSFEKRGLYNLASFNSNVEEIANKIGELCNIPVEEMTLNPSKEITNIKLQTKAYDFEIDCDKFTNNFKYIFTDTIESITNEILNNWNRIKINNNRIKDEYKDYNIIKNCRVCNTKISELLDLNTQPLANEYHNGKGVLKQYPLKLMLCDNCFHVQLNCVVDPEKLFNNYLYISGTSDTLKNYFKLFAEYTVTRHPGPYNKLKILDIACNDGSQLDCFPEEYTRVGVDPAKNIYETITKNKKLDIYCEYFTQSTVTKLKEKYHDFDIIIAQNVFAHVDNPGEFLRLCKQLMNDNTVCFIQTSQKNMIKNGEFDTAYHEHLSFFSTNSMKLLCESNDLFLNKVSNNVIHGTSYIFEILKTHMKSRDIQGDYNVIDVIYKEMCENIYDVDFYKKYTMNCLMYRNDFHNKLLEYKLNNKKIIGFGSTAKSNTLLNFCKIDNTLIDCIIDENPLKQGLYTPGSNIPIVPIEYLNELLGSETVIVVLAWNFFDEIKKKLKFIKDKNITILNIWPLQEFI